MNQIRLGLEDQVVAIDYPEGLQSDIQSLFWGQETSLGLPRHLVVVRETEAGKFDLQCEGQPTLGGLNRETCLLSLAGAVVEALITDLDSGVALHAGALSWHGRGILLPGTTGAGKSCLSAWLAHKGFAYLTDECVVLRREPSSFTALPRPLVTKDETLAPLLEQGRGARSIVSGSTSIFWPGSMTPTTRLQSCRFILFPRFQRGAALRVEPLSAAQTALELMACNVNARNLPDHGLRIVTAFARDVPAMLVRYGGFDQLDEKLEELLKLAVTSDAGPASIRHALELFKPGDDAVASVNPPAFPPLQRESSKMPAATPRGKPRKLTIGMAAYDDYDGVYFTLQALRMYHPEIVNEAEFIVVDNNPGGACSGAMKALENPAPNFRYVPYAESTGTMVRNRVFEEASGELVLCIDCHVFIVPGAVRKLIDYYDRDRDTRDLLQGPLLYDDLDTLSTHFEPSWREGMFGVWKRDDRAADPEAEPVDIPMQGLGLFACRRAAWPGFNPKFRGFGGEEGYIHEKIRRAGGRTLCLPFLRWMHRFNRPMGTGYANSWDDRIRNYMIGFAELGWDLNPLKAHFAEFLGPWVANPIFERVEPELAEYLARGGAQREKRPSSGIREHAQMASPPFRR